MTNLKTKANAYANTNAKANTNTSTNAKTNVNVRIDADIKELATRLLARMGIDQTTAIDMFYRQIIAERRLPFQPIVSQTRDE